MRSESSLPRGTFSHAPLPGISCTQSRLRSSSSPMRCSGSETLSPLDLAIDRLVGFLRGVWGCRTKRYV